MYGEKAIGGMLMWSNNKNYIKRLKNKKEDALEFIVDKYLGIVKGTVNKIILPLNNKEIIEECINDIFLSLWNNSEKFIGENSNHYVNAQSNTYYCDMIGKIDEKATKLIITPVIELCDEIIFDEKGFPIGKIDI